MRSHNRIATDTDTNGETFLSHIAKRIYTLNRVCVTSARTFVQDDEALMIVSNFSLINMLEIHICMDAIMCQL